MGFWSPKFLSGYQSPLPGRAPNDAIFYWEALAVVSALDWACSTLPIPRCLIVYSDNTNTVDMFNSLKALPQYNELLKTAVDILLLHSIEIRVFHIPGKDNVMADALSRFDNDLVYQLAPTASISLFQPPQSVMNA
ncbi:hypothetical protein PUNSTDRAFT_77509 [Punctularia strigosozonata HHB-11173 SS5]|uniref:RNase H type-1 domain-containing protein n=1 Tax=Punctularia strigosozonata (strain HHB-11173) TaxID=741275 RepID=R7S264_PUNST|nr:uncharacterized protein PUNSTDRAFT_77509 [Punctularia strigosozonata HHB-11173 SS5]EIN03872.1 hypothetical protein PUNSTDRAFT_77509 [Punctularia strigosozonata HHB-11173 SS5]